MYHTSDWDRLLADGVPAAARPLSQDARALLIGLMASMAYALAHGLVDTLYFLPDLALAFMLTLGIVAALDLHPASVDDKGR